MPERSDIIFTKQRSKTSFAFSAAREKGILVEALTYGGAKVPLASRAQEMARRVRPLQRKNELKF